MILPSRSIHSDFVVHWTGKDIDKDDKKWRKDGMCQVTQEIADRYVDRFKSILRFGLWMMRDGKEATAMVSGVPITRPTPFRTCFTELKLSEVRSHAHRYGRLGSGFKR